MLKREWKGLVKNKLLLLVIVAVIAIPTIYTTLFLGSMWDPYGNVDKLPVAVVNEDKEVTYEGKTLRVGKELVDNLKENDSLNFQFVNREQAEQGLKDGSYYMTIIIPENFSHNASTLTDKKPEKMELSYETNPGTNYIASKMSESAMEKIKNEVSSEVTKTYTETVFDQLKDIGDGMQEASDGSKELKNGLNDAKKGNDTINENLKVLADSTLTFKEGSDTLEVGLKQYIDGVDTVQNGVKALASGVDELAKQVTDGAKQLQAGEEAFGAGVKAYTDGVSTASKGAKELTKNSDILKAGAKQVADGASQLQEGSNALTNGLETMSSQIKLDDQTKAQAEALVKGLPQINEGIQKLNEALNSTSTEMTQEQMVAMLGQLKQQVAQLAQQSNTALPGGAKMIRSMSDGLLAVKQGLDSEQGLIAGSKQISQGLDTLENGINGENGLYEGIEAYTAGTAKVSEGLATLDSNTKSIKKGANDLTQGVSKLATGISDGTKQLSDGSSALLAGMTELTNNNETLLDGTKQLADGAGKISDGASQLQAGSDELSDGFTKLSDGAKELSDKLSDGAKEIKDTNTNKKVINMFSSPVDAKETMITTVENNGHAMAPYMMSVALWVGCIAFSLMYPLTKYEGELKSGFAWWGSKASVLYVVAGIQALVMVSLLHVFNGFSPVEMTKTLGFAVLASLTFMSIMYFFTNTFGKVGSFLMLVFMVVQLAGSVGTYPLEVSGEFVPYLHGWVPFTYTVHGFRSTIAGGESIEKDCMVLVGWLIVFTILTILEFGFRTKKIKAGEPLLFDWLEEKGLA